MEGGRKEEGIEGGRKRGTEEGGREGERVLPYQHCLDNWLYMNLYVP